MTDKDKILQKHELKYRNENPLQLQHPFRAISAGKSNSGKSYWLLKNLLLDPMMPFDKVIWCAPAFSLEQAKLQDVKKVLGSKLVFVEGLDEEKLKEMVDVKPKKEQWLIVFDDLMSKTDNGFINDLFTSGRHKNISTIEVLQRVYAGKSGRTHRLNCDYFMLHSFGDGSEVRSLLRQLDPKNFNKVYDWYCQSIKRDKGHGCLIIDNQYHGEHVGGGLLKYRDSALDRTWVGDSDSDREY